jgi:hypothetical protein
MGVEKAPTKFRRLDTASIWWWTLLGLRGMSVRLLVSILIVLASLPAQADYRITRDFGGLVDQYKAKYTQIRDRGERVIIDGICNSACTLVLGIVPLKRICVTPRASLGFHAAYFDRSWTFGLKVTSNSGTADLMSYYPTSVRDWIRRKGGLTPEMKRVRNGPDLWTMVDPCPDEF